MKRNIIFSLTIAAIVAVFSSCDGPTITRHKVCPLTLTSEQSEIAARQNEYSLSLLREMAQTENGNVFISPLSAAFVSAMIANGANGVTQTEILQAIGAEGYQMSELNAHYLNMMECLPYQDATSFVALANAVWVAEDYPINPVFSDAVRTHYLAEVDNLPLADPASADVINAWAKKQTKGMINKICDGSYFNEDLRLVLLNALCFQGKWDEQFKRTDTYDQPFHAATGDVDVPMMHGELEKCIVTAPEKYDLEKEELVRFDMRVLRMYYKDRGYCMDIVLPAEDKTLDDILPTLSVAEIDEMLRGDRGYVSYDADVTFPKLKLQCGYNLKPYMQALGMKTVFTDAADLGGISDANDLFLALLKQDTYLEVDEEGTKAAAVTSGWICNKAEAPSEPFVCDRPFVLLIRDVKNGVVLFTGLITNPKG